MNSIQHFIRMPIIIIILFSIFCNQCESNNVSHYTPNTDRCSNFSGARPNTSLVGCQPAKFMANDEYECYDKVYKESENIFDDDMDFSCWSRKDYSEKFLKRELNISNSYRYEEYNASFTASFQFNGTSGHPTSIKCKNDIDKWAQTWYDVSYQSPYFPCNTSSIPIIANFLWNGRQKM